MGDRYWIQIACAWCGTQNPSSEKYKEDPMENGIYYAPSSGFIDFTCSECKKLNWILTGHYARKVENKKELEKLYEREGFGKYEEKE